MNRISLEKYPLEAQYLSLKSLRSGGKNSRRYSEGCILCHSMEDRMLGLSFTSSE